MAELRNDAFQPPTNMGEEGGGASQAPNVNFSGGGTNVSMWGNVISGVTSAYTSYLQGKMASQTMTFNAEIKKIQSRLITHMAKIDANRTRERGARFIKTQKARYAKAGVRMEGSPIEVQIDTMANFEYDARMTEINAFMRSSSKELEASALEKKGKYYEKAGMRKAGMSLLSTGMDVVAAKYSPQGR